MLIGLIGAQRVGKTILAKAMAAEYPVTYVDASISTFVAQLGLDSGNQSYDFETRVKIQEHLFNSLYSLLSTLDPNVVHVVDRTFYDLIFYTISAIDENTSDEYYVWLQEYIDACHIAQAELFQKSVYIVPGIEVDNSKSTSAKASKMIQQKAHLIFMGILSEDTENGVVPMYTQDLNIRLNQLNLVICGAYRNA